MIKNILNLLASVENGFAAHREYDLLNDQSDKHLKKAGLERRNLHQHVFAKYINQ